MEVACTAIGEAKSEISVAIISPYRAQVRLLRNWLRQETRSENLAYQRIEAGTVHQFQGSDADFVIFDIVDGIGRPTLGTLLREDTGLRLTTVAITRAKGKVVVIADRKWYQAGAKREDNPLLWDLIVGPGINHIFVDPPSPEGSRGQNQESPIERALREAMSEHDVLSDIEQEFRIRDESGFVVTRADFAFPKFKYAIYCDGAEWHLKHDRWQKDLRQRNKLTELGWRFSVFPGRAILQDSKTCAVQVAKTLETLKAARTK
jgi:very-short-patch-repair endonuclease